MRTKRVFELKQKTCFIIFKEISLKQVKQIFWEGESPNLTPSFRGWGCFKGTTATVF